MATDNNKWIVNLNAREYLPLRLGEPIPVVYCRDCKYYEEHHYELEGEPPYIKGKCGNKFGLNRQYRVHPEEFCSRGERKEANDER